MTEVLLNDSITLKQRQCSINSQQSLIQSRKLKNILISSINLYDKKPLLLSIFKFSFGFFMLGLPSFIIYLLIYIIQPIHFKYLILSLLITFSLCCALMIFTLIVKISENWTKHGPIFPSWERKGLFSLISCIIFNIFLIIIIKQLEGFFSNVVIFKGIISQVKEDLGRTLNQGTYIFKLLFLVLFWDKKHDTLDYFDLPKKFQEDFRNEVVKIIKPILVLAIYYSMTLILFVSKHAMEYLCISVIVIYECFYFIYFPIGDDYDYNQIQFLYSNTQYFEIIPLFIVIGIIGWVMVNKHIIALWKKKLYSYKSREKNQLTIIMVIVSNIIITIGLIGIMVILIIFLCSLDINPNLKHDDYQSLCFYFSTSLLCITIGSSYIFGHYYFSLVYKPIVNSRCKAVLKTHYYIYVPKWGRRTISNFIKSNEKLLM